MIETLSLPNAISLPGLEVLLSADWNSTISNHRQLIRQYLVQKIGDQNLLNLDGPPQTTEFSISISHCPVFGGIALAKKPHAVGFDVELVERINETIARRIAKGDEFAHAPDAASLWVAKEASYKALLGPKQPPVVTEITIKNWQPANGSVVLFNSSTINQLSVSIRGAVFTKDRLKMGIAIKLT